MSLTITLDPQGRLKLPGEMNAAGLYSVIVAPQTGGGVLLVTREGERNLPLPIRVISRRVPIEKGETIRLPPELIGKLGGQLRVRIINPGMWLVEQSH